MKENKKYYTPLIEEFFAGFKYEMFYDNEWHKTEYWASQFNPNIFVGYTKEALSKIFRVKYLDKEDIESLGFKLQSSSLFKKGNIFISFGHEKYTQINNGKNVFFQGIIKNKSQLKQVLKQIGVIVEN